MSGENVGARGSGVGAVALFEAIPDIAAVLDAHGSITATNGAWSAFGRCNEADPETCGVGANYLRVCEDGASAGNPDAESVACMLRSLLSGKVVQGSYEYPCHAPHEQRWFIARMSRIDDPPGVLVLHTDITSRKLKETDSAWRADRDPLTGLANRRLFAERLGKALTERPDRAVPPDIGVLYIDLNDFKSINDTYGHLAGDQVLETVGGRLLAVTRASDTVARLGGDEFGIIAPRISADLLELLVGRVNDSLGRPHELEARPVVVRASVGSYLAQVGQTVGGCLLQADQAMYAVKRRRSR